MEHLPPPAEYDEDIATYEVSEDGVTWRPYDPATDRQLTLHRRIQFAPPQSDGDAPARSC